MKLAFSVKRVVIQYRVSGIELNLSRTSAYSIKKYIIYKYYSNKTKKLKRKT